MWSLCSRRRETQETWCAVLLRAATAVILSACLTSCWTTGKPPTQAVDQTPEVVEESYRIVAEPYRISAGDTLEVAYLKKPPTHLVKAYRVDYFDLLQVEVIGHDMYKAETTVRPDGRISFFHVDDVQAKGKTVSEIRTALEARFAKTVPSAKIAIFLKSSGGSVDVFIETLSNHRDGTVRTVTVASDGNIELPLISGIKVLGETLGTAREKIEKTYEKQFSGTLGVTLSLISSMKSNVLVLGEVKNPGLYSIRDSIPAVHALGMAGGALNTADTKHAFLLRRRSSGELSREVIDLAIERKKKNTEIALVQAEDILIVPKKGIAKANLLIEQYLRRMIPVNVGFGLTYRLNSDDDN